MRYSWSHETVGREALDRDLHRLGALQAAKTCFEADEIPLFFFFDSCSGFILPYSFHCHSPEHRCVVTKPDFKITEGTAQRLCLIS